VSRKRKLEGLGPVPNKIAALVSKLKKNPDPKVSRTALDHLAVDCGRSSIAIRNIFRHDRRVVSHDMLGAFFEAGFINKKELADQIKWEEDHVHA